MPENTQEKIIVTHNASFHADDVFAVATLLLSMSQGSAQGQSVKVIRTRDPEEIAAAHYVVDVGGIYDPATNRFDHHQKGGAGKRDNGIPYAAFGLVWKHIGQVVCNNDMDLWQKIDTDLVCGIDANDNGFDISKNLIEGVFPASLSLNFMIEKPTWEERSNDDQMYERFMHAVVKAKFFLERYITVQLASIKAKREIKATYEASQHKAIIIFPHDYERVNFMQTLAVLPEIIFFIYPNHSGTWTAETVPVGEGSFEKRKPFPEAWAGLSGEALVAASGVPDAYFCHNGRFVAYATSEEGAINLAKIALES
ncbi:MAG: MYG1 family protein [Candidatus Pacebacteria bacterium]|nr:MYG1 family protein [Candidatus Paceibacterota bacterium]